MPSSPFAKRLEWRHNNKKNVDKHFAIEGGKLNPFNGLQWWGEG